MPKFLVVLALCITVVLGGVVLYQSGCKSMECVTEKFSLVRRELTPVLPSTQNELDQPIKEEIVPSPTIPEKKITTPGPLKVIRDAILGEKQSLLTKKGVIDLTNNERVAQGLSKLSENSKLDSSAEAKVDDMFANQYFEHISPTGVGVDNLAENVHYEYIVVGENLALGNFKDDQAVVTAWMKSPGHRANILNARYQEIGVAVKRGNFEGREVWLAVQEFGKPLASCPSIDPFTKLSIESNKQQTESLQTSLNHLRQEIDSMEPKYGDVYNKKVDEYNSLIPSYNALVTATRSLVDTYNAQVKLFNECITR